jgi:pyridoxine 5-phosphate synthase
LRTSSQESQLTSIGDADCNHHHYSLRHPADIFHAVILEVARLARKIGLGVNAGHDLDLKNIPAYVKVVKGLQEVSISHALISDALYMGLTRTVKAYLKALGSKPLKAKRVS